MRSLTTGFQDPNLDILRSIAVLAVFAGHLLQVLAGCRFGEHYAYGVETYSLGHAGVLIFFVHTSLVLMQSLDRADQSGWALVRSFYIRRAFRLYPLSICLIVIAIAFSIPPNALGVPYIWHGARWALANLLLVQNIGKTEPISSPMWSLAYEVQMYLALPVLFLLLRARRGTRLSAIYIVGLFLGLLHPQLRYVPCFLAGVIAYSLLGIVRPRFRSWLWYPALLGAVAVYTLTSYDYGWIKDVLVCLSVGALIPLFRKNRGIVATVASNIAKYSYGIYLCHTPILWLVYRKLTIPNWERLILVALAMVTVPVVCYRLIEHPLIRIGTRLAKRMGSEVEADVGRTDRLATPAAA
jgi:peptidoglycan/LPS O-acetylase OafA/YrhL